MTKKAEVKNMSKLDTESNLVKHAKREFEVLGWPGEDEMQELMCGNVIELLGVFAAQGHSGSSAPYLLAQFIKLAKFEPISPLTGEDSEWNEVGGPTTNGKQYQNNRCSHVFKNDGGAYDINGKVFVEPDGCSYTNKDSHVPVEFPYNPHVEFIDVPKLEGQCESEG